MVCNDVVLRSLDMMAITLTVPPLALALAFIVTLLILVSIISTPNSGEELPWASRLPLLGLTLMQMVMVLTSLPLLVARDTEWHPNAP